MRHVLDAEEGVVLGNTLRTSRSTGLDLSDAKSDDQVSNECVLGFTTTVGNHDTPAVGLRELGTV